MPASPYSQPIKFHAINKPEYYEETFGSPIPDRDGGDNRIDDLNTAIELLTDSFRVKVSRMSADQYRAKYRELLDYMKEALGVETDQELYEHMAVNRTAFWSQLPGEDWYAYKLFIYYLQLPKTHRHISNVVRLYVLLDENKNPDYVLHPGFKHSISQQFTPLFWDIRAELHERYMQNELLDAMDDDSMKRIIANRNRALVLSGLTADISIQMLAKAEQALQNINVDDMTIKEIALYVKTAITAASDASKQTAEAAGYSELLALHHELELLTQEEERFINADPVDVI